MLSDLLHDRAALFVAGAMSAPERESFELLLEYHDELRAQVVSLQKIGTAVVLARARSVPALPADLKRRILGALDSHPRQTEPDAMVVTDAQGGVAWVNPAFTAMCGHTLVEIKGRKPGHILRGPETDPAAALRLREAITDKRPCRETLVNYHKDGSPYRVDIQLYPIIDDDGQPLWFVARERKLAD
jgi:PAS domain S-box-containing protein